MRVRHKSVTLEAEQVDRSTSVRTKEGTLTARKGDYIIKDNNDRWVVSKQDFPRLYDVC